MRELTLQTILGLAFMSIAASTACSDSDSPPARDKDGAQNEQRAPSNAAEQRYDLNDVSLLYPLPTADKVDSLLALTRTGPHGDLISAALYAQLNASVSAGFARGSFHVVGVRVDPCAPSTALPGSACIKEIRLIAQPVVTDDASGALRTRDAAIHLFYDPDDAGWNDLLARLSALKTLAAGMTDGAPLGVHPVMVSEGLEGPYAQALNQLVLAVAGEQNLVRVATSVLAFDQSWTFRSFERTGDVLEIAPIPRLGTKTEQEFINTTADPNIGKMMQLPTPDDVSLLLDGTKLPSAPIDDVTTAVRGTLRSENPNVTNRLTTDCVTCHVSTRALGLAKTTRGIDITTFPERFTDSRFELRLDSEVVMKIEAQRAFGYLDAKPAFSQRVINESAVIAAALSGGTNSPPK